jgi:7-cyano-7-deazaguanine synthase in queuosine biosynthesis
LYIDLGQKNIDAAKKASHSLAEAHCGGRHIVITISGANHLFESPKIGITVAHQAALLHTLGASIAVANGFSVVASGQRRGASSTSFPYYLEQLLKCSTITGTPEFILPVFTVSDEEVYAEIKNDPLWKNTVTCNQHPPCGTCGRCKIRAEWLKR